MQKIFVADEGFKREFARSRAKGHKNFVISDDVECFDSVSLRTDGTTLVMDKLEKDESDEECYIVLCKEFGLVGESMGHTSDLSVILLDDGWMLVTLVRGAVVINLDEKMLMPSVGVDKVPPVAPEDIYWVTADYILSYAKYWDIKGKFIYDYELMLTLAGQFNNNLQRTKIHLIDEDCIDISLGYIAQYEQEMAKRQEAKAAADMYNEIMKSSSESSYEFDEDDFDEDEDEEEDEDDIYGL